MRDGMDDAESVYYGRKPGFEWWRVQRRAREQGWTREQLVEYENDPDHYRVEDPTSNRSSRYDSQLPEDGQPPDDGAGDRDRFSDLHEAALNDDAARVAELIDAGADLDLQTRDGLVPLHLAAQQYSVESARLLLDAGAAVDVRDVDGNSPLMNAAFESSGRGRMIELLREHGADPDLANRHGQTPRGLAKLLANYDVAQFFEDWPAKS